MSALRNWTSNALAALAVSSVVAGCASTGSVTRPPAPVLVASDKALVFPPPGGPAIVGVIERPHSNGTHQTIALATTSQVPGENYIKIEFFGPDRGPGQPMAFRTISEGGIRREASAAIPGVRLTRRTTFLQNSYGPFSYAVGRSSSADTCLYAWQQIRAGTTSSGIGRGFGMIQVRWRLCDAHASEEQLLSAIYGYTIVGTFSGSQWSPFGEPKSSDPRLGSTGHPIYPAAGSPTGSMPRGYAGGIEFSPPPTPAVSRGQPAGVQSNLAPNTDGSGPAVPRVPSPDAMRERTATAPDAAGPKSNGARPNTTVPSPDSILLQNRN